MKQKRTLFLIVFFMFFSFSILRTQTASSAPAEVHYSLTQTELETTLKEIQTLLNEGAYLEAKKRYETLIQYDLSEADRKIVRKSLNDLNVKILFSPILTRDSFQYTVKKGDSLYDIAKAHNTTIELIKKSNSLNKDTIRPDMKLKITKAIFSVSVDVSENKLTLFADKKPFKVYSVATGRKDHETPIGTFKIVNKLENPVWYKTGVAVPPESPKNILGTRWLGFDLDSYGIHGTTLPETVGTAASEGCIRMFNHEVEELYSIIPAGTTVTIAE